MPDGRPLMHLANPPAIAVVAPFIFRYQNMRSEDEIQRFAGDQLLALHRLCPVKQILNRRIKRPSSEIMGHIDKIRLAKLIDITDGQTFRIVAVT